MKHPKIKTEEEYRKRLAELEEWMADGDRPAPQHIESLIQAIVDYEAENFPFPI